MTLPIVNPEPCPRCHQKCPWCSDYRWMHGQRLRRNSILPACDVEFMQPDDECAVCGGSRKVIVERAFRRVGAA
jgi:hypothetical protein